MKDEARNERMEGRMKMWKMRKEMLDSMSEKELRAFINGYMMAESMMMRRMRPRHGGGWGRDFDSKEGSRSDYRNK